MLFCHQCHATRPLADFWRNPQRSNGYHRICRYCARARRGYIGPMLRTAEYFWSKVDKTGECWPWLGGKKKHGYGQTSWRKDGEKRNISAHRVAFFLEYGRWPEPCCLHKCDNPPCCRPDHLFEGTQQVNRQDTVSKERQARGEKQGHARLTETIVKKIRQDYANGMGTMKEIGEPFGLDASNVNKILKRQAWAHVK